MTQIDENMKIYTYITIWHRGTGQNPPPAKKPPAKTPLLQKSPTGQNPLRQKAPSGK